ncbi:MAG: hypothetical protein AB1630_07490, partial [bacterium]
IRLALKHKDDLSVLGSISKSVELYEGLSVGAVWTVYQAAKHLRMCLAGLKFISPYMNGRA